MCNISLNRHGRLLYYTLFERVTFCLYNDTEIMPNRNTLLKLVVCVTTGMFSLTCVTGNSQRNGLSDMYLYTLARVIVLIECA